MGYVATEKNRQIAIPGRPTRVVDTQTKKTWRRSSGSFLLFIHSPGHPSIRPTNPPICPLMAIHLYTHPFIQPIHQSIHHPSFRPSTRSSIYVSSIDSSNQSNHPSIQQLTYSFIHPNIHPSSHHLTRSFIHASNQSNHSSNHLIHSSINLFINPPITQLVHPSIHPSLDSSIHPSIKPTDRTHPHCLYLITSSISSSVQGNPMEYPEASWDMWSFQRALVLLWGLLPFTVTVPKNLHVPKNCCDQKRLIRQIQNLQFTHVVSNNVAVTSSQHSNIKKESHTRGCTVGVRNKLWSIPEQTERDGDGCWHVSRLNINQTAQLH